MNPNDLAERTRGEHAAPADQPAAVLTAVEELMHLVDELDRTDAASGPDGASVQRRQAELFEQAHQLLVDSLDSVERA